MAKTTACTVARAVALGFGLLTSACGPEPARRATLAELEFVEVTASFSDCTLVGHDSTFQLKSTFEGHALDGGV